MEKVSLDSCGGCSLLVLTIGLGLQGALKQMGDTWPEWVCWDVWNSRCLEGQNNWIYLDSWVLHPTHVTLPWILVVFTDLRNAERAELSRNGMARLQGRSCCVGLYSGKPQGNLLMSLMSASRGQPEILQRMEGSDLMI